jgi:hypothetical protein
LAFSESPRSSPGAGPREDSRPEARYRLAFQSAYATLNRAAILLAEARNAAPALHRELRRLPAEQQRLLVRNGGRFANLGLAELLLQRAQRECTEAPQAGAEAALLAIDVLESLGGDGELQSILQDLEARTQTVLGLCRLREGDLAEASARLARARCCLARGSGDPLEEGGLLEAEADLYAARRSSRAARLGYQRAAAAYRRAGEETLACRVLLRAAAEAGTADLALRLLQEARGTFPPAGDPTLLLAIERNLIAVLQTLGRGGDAAAAMARARKLALALGSRSELARLRQAGGRVVPFAAP